MKPTNQVFATTIGAETFARDTYQGEFPIVLDVRVAKIVKGRPALVVLPYTLPRKPTMQDLRPVGTLGKAVK